MNKITYVDVAMHTDKKKAWVTVTVERESGAMHSYRMLRIKRAARHARRGFALIAMLAARMGVDVWRDK